MVVQRRPSVTALMMYEKDCEVSLSEYDSVL